MMKPTRTSCKVLLRAPMAVIGLAAALLTGCAFGDHLDITRWWPSSPPTVPVMTSDAQGLQTPMLAASYQAADHLAAMLAANGFDPAAPVLVASFVNIDDINQSTTMGRMLAEQIGGRLAQHGYRIVEMKLRSRTLAIRPKAGEFALSREPRQLSVDQDARAVLTGTYAVSRRVVYVSCRVLEAPGGELKAAWDIELPRNAMTMSMLTDQPPQISR